MWIFAKYVILPGLTQNQQRSHTTMRLYEIAVEGLELERILEETGGELTPELEARFDELLKAGPEKIEAAICVVRNLQAEAEAAKTEEQRFAKMRKSAERQVESLKTRIMYAVDAAFSGKIKTPVGTARCQTAKETTTYSLAPDVDMVKFAANVPMLVKTEYSLSTQALNDHRKLTGTLPPEILADDKPGKRFLVIT